MAEAFVLDKPVTSLLRSFAPPRCRKLYCPRLRTAVARSSVSMVSVSSFSVPEKSPCSLSRMPVAYGSSITAGFLAKSRAVSVRSG